MSSNETIIIIDDNEERCRKLSTILNFVGETCYLANYSNWRSFPYDKAHTIVAGAHESFSDSLGFLEELIHIAPYLSVILIDSPLPASHYTTKNVLASLHFPFTYSQMLEALHKCQIAQEPIEVNGKKEHRYFAV